MQKYPFIDYILCGEGELVFRDLVMYLQGNKSIEDVEGIVYRNGDETIYTNFEGMFDGATSMEHIFGVEVDEAEKKVPEVKF